MPASRTSTSSRSQLRGSPTRQLGSQPTVVLDEHGPGVQRSGSSMRRVSPPVARKRAVVQLGGVIEISSDEDEEPVNTNQRVMGELRKKVRKLEEEVSRGKKEKIRADDDLKQLRDENRRLQQGLEQQSREKHSVDMSQLQESILCEVCTTPMWSPHLLPGCGHTFCQSCLTDWFSTTQRQFAAAHPEANPHDPALNAVLPLIMFLQSNPFHGLHHPRFQQLLQTYENSKPKYTCPTCREPVRARPVENFAMKSVVRTVMVASAEKSPSKNLHKTDPWARYFPRTA